MNQASIFTLEKAGNSYKDFDAVPKDLYVDTSAWVAAYSSNSTYNPVRNFMAECVGKGTTLYHSPVVLSELIHVNEKSHYDKYADEYKKQARGVNGYNQKKLRELIRKNHPEIEGDIEKSQNNLLHIVQKGSEMLEYVSNASAIQEIIEIRKASGNILGVNDATHVYIARTYGINSFLTADGDFFALDNDNIYAPANEKYSKEKIGRANCFQEFDSTKY